MVNIGGLVIPEIEDLEIGKSVRVQADGTQKVGTVVGRRIANKVEGYLAPQNNNTVPSPDGPDMVQVAIPMEPVLGKWVTTGLMIFPINVELVD
jgi:hypothetical protein